MKSNESNLMPDISSHNEPTSVGMAVAKLRQYGISAEQIRFNIINKHPSLGEIVSQDPAPGVSLSLVEEVSLDVNSWSEHEDRRFSFFEAEELLQAENNLDEWQLEDWAEYKNFIVHVFARMDNIGELSHEPLLEKYILTQVIPFQLDEFRRLKKISEAIGKKDLLDPTQWKMLCGDLRKAAVVPITPNGLACLIAKYLHVDTDKIACKFAANKWVFAITKDQKNESDILKVKWLDYLFRPLDMQIEYKWKRNYNISKPDFLSPLNASFVLLAQKKKLVFALLTLVLVLIVAYVSYQPIPGMGLSSDSQKVKNPEIVSSDVGRKLKIEFDSGQEYIKPKYHHIIKEIAEYLKSNPGKNVLIEGHSDAIGNDKQTYGLSTRRAESVKNYLIEEFGIPSYRIKTRGFGPDKRIDFSNTPEGNKKNRRVMVKFSKPAN